MPDALFADPRLARLYDALEDARPDLDEYVAAAEVLAVRSVIDVGCGTGTLALLLAARGMDVTGVDPATASLDVARSKPGAKGVRWIEAAATDLPVGDVDLVTMTGNVAQVFVGDDEWATVLGSVRRALRTGGCFLFETRRPERRAWEDWTPEQTRTTSDVPGVGAVSSWVEVTADDPPFVSFRWTFVFERTGEIVTSDSTLRFRSRSEIEASLHAAGFDVVDVRDAPDRPGNEFVFVAAAV